jgi:hypothetical protein
MICIIVTVFLIEGGMDSILKYGIAFCEKKCKVAKAKTQF